MNKKIVPDFDYLAAKDINVKHPRALFDKLTLQMNKVSNENLKHDLLPLFVNRIFIEHWLENWHESFLRLLDDYKIRTLKGIEYCKMHQDFYTDNFYFDFIYNTNEGAMVRITYIMSDYWIDGVDLDIKIDHELIKKIRTADSWSSKPAYIEKLHKYATLFYKKTEKYLEKMNQVMLGDQIITKVIRMTADNLNQKEQIVLNKSALLSCELDDLLK